MKSIHTAYLLSLTGTFLWVIVYFHSLPTGMLTILMRTLLVCGWACFIAAIIILGDRKDTDT